MLLSYASFLFVLSGRMTVINDQRTFLPMDFWRPNWVQETAVKKTNE
jgi:hypothetical protein